jgi:peptidoglycan/LPS O-acetylase OafA/YrhL/cellulose synthase/poly-beta-1,6-N-acetylglucosamine synthase-like glycosyltransferase
VTLCIQCVRVNAYGECRINADPHLLASFSGAADSGLPLSGDVAGATDQPLISGGFAMTELRAPALLEQLAEPAFSLPQPPSEREKYAYMGRQHRWLPFAQTAAFSMIAYSVARFATADTRLLLFLFPMSLYCVTVAISLLSSGRKKRTDLIDHQWRVADYQPGIYPSVDVFLPTAGEPIELLANTYRHIQRLRWPGQVVVHVLDDSARSAVRHLAEEAGFAYHSRPNRGHLKKAGNLRYGYENSDGDFIAIFDADFVPRSEYLHELMPYFLDEEIGIVQSPQFFDTDKEMHWLQRCAGATQELFYRWIEPARDRSRAAICVGTCAVYRRLGLDKAGGFAQIGHSEDVHTGVNLLKAGFQLRYVPIVVSKGLCPDRLSSFLNQQYRWCTGSMSLLADPSFHRAEHITWRQRICFWSGFLYYISTGLSAFIAPLPALAMLYFLPQWVEPKNSVWLLGAFLLWFMVLPCVMRGHWRFDVLRVQVLYSFAHAVAIGHILTGRTQEWVATGTATGRTTPLAAKIARTARSYIALTQLLVYVGLWRGTTHYGIHQFWVMIALAGISTYIYLPVMLLELRVPRLTTLLRRGGARGTLIVLPEAVVLPTAVVVSEVKPTSTITLPDTDAAQRPTPHRVGGRARWLARPAINRTAAFRRDIQGLRAVAVLLVVLYHAGGLGISGGYVGVDVFFVISGFLISEGLLREVAATNRLSLSRFYVRRIRRLLPLATVVLVVTVIVARLWGSIFQVTTIAKDALLVTFYGINYGLALNGVDYQLASGPPSPLQHYWSLAVEEQFYVLWPLMVALCAFGSRRRSTQTRIALIGGLVAAISAMSLYFSVVTTTNNAPLAYFSLHTRAWELGVGVLLAVTANRLHRIPLPLAAVASWAGFAAIIGSGLVYTKETPFPGWAALVPVLGAGLVIAGGTRGPAAGFEWIFGRRLWQGIGRVSYGWYLWHWPALILAPALFGRKLVWWENLEMVTLALWLSVVSYWMLEGPALRTRLRRVRWFSAGLAMASVGTAAAVTLMLTVPSLIGTGAAAAPLLLAKANTDELQAALATGTSLRAVPSNLDPSLAKVRTDQPASSGNGCHANFLIVHQGICGYGDPKGTKVMVLFGDSHAQQWLPGLDLAAKKMHWKLIAWTKAACSAASYDSFSTELNRPYRECLQWRASTLRRIARLRPDRVIVSQSDLVPGTKLGNTQWADATVSVVRGLQSAKLQVGYILDTPYPATNVPECVANHLDDVGACVFKRDKAYRYTGRHETMTQTLAAAGVTTVEPADWLCTVSDCPVIVGGTLVYRDDSHLSTSYSSWLAPMLSPLFGES